MKQLILATGNPGKIREIFEILKSLSFEIKSLSDVGFTADIKETGNTFKENALIKAETVGRFTGQLTLAEDSGLEIEYLGGRPGIYSARYAQGSDSDRVDKVLKELLGVPVDKRNARFVCVAALFDPQENKTFFFEGESRGVITQDVQGKGGFGYDPIFYNPQLGKTNAQATPEEKNKVSHRALAILKARDFLLKY